MSSGIDRSNQLLVGTVGSVAYGLATPESDIDRLGIYAAPMRTVLGLKGSAAIDDPEAKQAVDDSHVTHEPDITLHEVGKYISLALAANPTILELLWLPDSLYTTRTATGQFLIEDRELFLSSTTIKAKYGGYAKAQAERLMRRQGEGKDGFDSSVKNRTAKHGRHCCRLLLQASQLLATGTMSVDVSEHRDYLFEVGELASSDPEAFYGLFQMKLAAMDEIDSVLPEYPDREGANSLLIDIRMEADLER